MSGVGDGKPENVDTFSLADGRSAVYISREKKHFSTLHDGYPLAEDFLDDLKTKGVNAIVIDGDEGVYVFDLHQYQRGDRLGHAPYPMKRVVSIHDAESAHDEPDKEVLATITEWEWLTDNDLEPGHDRPGNPDSSSSYLSQENYSSH
ncbi:hypothetical protein [Natronobacterium lacisalsi]|nr:hypothetical protein [Halobiforma lacisalsi]